LPFNICFNIFVDVVPRKGKKRLRFMGMVDTKILTIKKETMTKTVVADIKMSAISIVCL